MAMVERSVRHLTDFRPFPDARFADVSTKATVQKELSLSPNTKKKRNNKSPFTQVCVGWPPQQPSKLGHRADNADTGRKALMPVDFPLINNAQLKPKRELRESLR
jgi:hypothetical protein